MAKFVDGFVIPIPKRKVAAYRKIAKEASRIWMKHGALEYFETVQEPFKLHPGLKSFERAARAKSGETVIFAWIVYKSKAHRNQVNKKVESDPGMQKFFGMEMPFDMKRMTVGLFKTIVEA